MDQQPIIRKKPYQGDSEDKQRSQQNKGVDKLLSNLQKVTLLDILDEFAKESENKSITDLLKTILGNVQNKEPEAPKQWNQDRQDKPYNKFNQKFESNNNDFQNNRRNNDYQGKSNWNDQGKENRNNSFRGNRDDRPPREDRPPRRDDRQGRNNSQNQNWKPNNDWNVKTTNEQWGPKKSTEQKNEWKNNSSWTSEPVQEPPSLSWGTPHK